ncbi:Cloroperoxidase [Lenzites betulinus]|nr:Cloroperoxidase [Lenzites betulinus]
MSTTNVTNDDDHSWIPATAEDSRCPCPALNVLANHGYLPRDGRNLTAAQLSQAVQKVYGISWLAATILAYGGVKRCSTTGKVDLHDLALHNAAEHDYSLVHADAKPGEKYAPTTVDPELLRELLDKSSKDYLTLRDLTRTYVARHDAKPPLELRFRIISKGEMELIVEVFGVRRGDASASVLPDEVLGSEPVVPKAFIRQWLGEERLPDGWKGPAHPTGLFDILKGIRQVANLQQELTSSKAE